MNENSYLKISCIVLYLAFAAISCWATAESLHLLLPDWPLVAAWAVTIGFFFIASWGTKMITDSLNQDIYMDNRGLHLLGGIFIVLVFWLLCSMPTNTHTFFYRSHVRESDKRHHDHQGVFGSDKGWSCYKEYDKCTDYRV